MSNPLGLLGYVDPDESEEEDDDEEAQLDTALPTADPSTASPLGADDLYGDLADTGDGQHSGAAGEGSQAAADDVSPVGRADVIDAQTDAFTIAEGHADTPGGADLPDGEAGPAPIVATGDASDDIVATGDASDDIVATGDASDDTPEHLRIPSPRPCPERIRARTEMLMSKQDEMGVQMLQVLRDNKGYRNPAFMERMVAHYNVQQYSSCFPTDKFDPTSLPPEDYIGPMNKELELKRQARRAARAKAARPVAVATLPAPPPAITAPSLPARSFIPAMHKPSAASLGDRLSPKRRAPDSVSGHTKRPKWDRNR